MPNRGDDGFMASELGRFLRARRGRITPQQAGLAPGGGQRRVTGLRREELAQLAGISTDYYVHIEQGRTKHVSGAVLEAIARVLALTDDEREHLGNLARPVARGRPRPTRRVSAGTRLILDLMYDVPAVILGRRTEILAMNAAAVAVFGDLMESPGGSNAARRVFLEPVAQTVYRNWDAVAADLVGQLRLEAGRDPDDADMAALIGELSVKSEGFRRLWARGDVKHKNRGVTQITHPAVGELDFTYETMLFPDIIDQSLVAYGYTVNSPTAERLRILLSWATPDTQAQPHDDRTTPHVGES
jgi:transcriptional regulator with XRE-family HTH domain